LVKYFCTHAYEPQNETFGKQQANKDQEKKCLCLRAYLVLCHRGRL